ncbi:SDR family NAD(P)-dependent oxidoreductase [Streptomyces sp. A7024]|uniref:SDR family NAD(P)-dependent oxidoreductase n=1 Tax=Streptomyces coryli TaxID=1128680 RepID=A0A6G4TZ55_9ACTN|nr:oxidoreductase [Streptomyces coryli]NGN65174.1 SDR family NAD(P)-dependent oxidoreductase [Streptomyces coryli]
MSAWSARDIPDQSGRTAVVTGANSGIGYAAARELARAGARVVLACRSEHRGGEALARLRAEVPGAEAELRPLDLGDLKSVRDFADGLPGSSDGSLDLLINNAGVMAIPYGETADGFETQIGVNHLGHFALTGLLLPRLTAAERARVVSVSSLFHFTSQVDLNDLHMRRRYRRWVQYGRSKSADLLFVHELARRLARAGSDVVAAAAHPGYAATNLQAASVQSEHRPLAERIFAIGNRLIAQSADDGALPTLFAATAPGVHPDTFIGPRVLGWRGAPSTSTRAKWTLNDAASQRLWEESERLTGVTYEGLG